MNKRILSLLFIGLLSVGCGESDPSKANNGASQNNGNPNNGGMTSNNGGMTDNNGGMTSNNGGMTSNNGSMTSNNGTTTMVCDDSNLTFYGQIASDGVHGGGVPGDMALTPDSGLDALFAYLTTPVATDTRTDTLNSKGEMVGDTYVLAAPIAITGAVVTGTWSDTAGNGIFWVEDQKRGFPVRLEMPVAETIKVGDALNFSVSKLVTYAGVPQIAAIEGFSIVSNGNTVSVQDRTGMDLVESDLYKTVRIRGTIGEGSPCGGKFKCYDMSHGGKTITYRSQSNFDGAGDCITFVGVVSAFPGPFADNYNFTSGAQLTAENFDWARAPFKE